MTGLGETLRKARERAGLSLDEAEELTKIRRKHLSALEAEDFLSLPDAVYVKGFVKNYAVALGLDPAEMLDLLPVRAKPIEMRPAVTLQKAPRGIGMLLFVGLVILLVGALAVYLYNFAQYGRASAPHEDVAIVIPTITALPTATTVPIVIATQTVTTTNTEGLEIKIRAIDRTWLAIYVDGDARAIYNGTMEIGETQTFSGRQRIYVHSGNAGGVDYTLNGQRKGLLGKPGEVTRLEWSVPLTGTTPQVRTVAPSERPFNTPAAGGATPPLTTPTSASVSSTPKPAATTPTRPAGTAPVTSPTTGNR